MSKPSDIPELSLDPISAIELSIINHIEQASKNQLLGYKLPLVASYGGEIEDDNIPSLIRNASPAVWVTNAGENNLDGAVRHPTFELIFGIVVFCRDSQNESASRFGTLRGVGVYRIINDLKKLLNQQTLGLNISPLEYVSAAPIYKGKLKSHHTTIYGLKFKTTYQHRGLSDKPFSSLDEFLRLNSFWTIGQAPSTLDINIRSQQKNG